MSIEMMRTHVVIPKALVETIDALVGKRHRSEFLTEAAEKEVRRLKLIKAVEKAGGSLDSTAVMIAAPALAGSPAWLPCMVSFSLRRCPAVSA